MTITNFVSSEDVLAFTNNGSTMGNIAASFNSSTGVLSLKSSGMTATKAEWQVALRAVTYANSSDTPTTTTRSVDFVIEDGTELSSTLTSTVAITAVNDVPIAQASSATTNEDTAKTFASSDFSFTDAESNALASVTVSNLTLASGDTLTVDQGSGQVTVTNGMTITAAQLASLTYTPDSNANGAARSTFDFRVNDANNGTVTATMSLDVTAVNDAPVAQTSSVTEVEDTPKTFAVSDFQFTEVEGDALVSVTMSGLALASGDTLTVDQGSGPVTVTIGMTITSAEIASLIYTPALNGNGSARSTFDFKVNDADLGTAAATMSVNVTAVNDAPVALASSVTTNEEAPKTFAASDFQFADPESNSLVSITVSNLTLVGGDTLTVDQGAGAVAVTNGMTITAAQIATMVYTPALDVEGPAHSTFDFMGNDADLGTVAATMSMNVTGINDVPVAQTSNATTSEDTTKTFVVADFTFTDVESDALVSVTVSNVTLAVGDTLTVDQGSGPVAVTNGMTITAAQMATMVYTPVANASGAARSTFDFTVNDAGTGTVSATMNINVSGVNDIPVAQPSSLTLNEDTVGIFAASDFQFTDTEGNSLVSILVSELNLASGDTLTVDQGSGSIPVTDGMTITAAQIATMVYTPVSNASGAARSTLDFMANDTSSGTMAATMSINVTAVNDVPVAQANSVTTNEDTAPLFAASDFLFADVESDSLASVTISNLTLASGDTLTVDQGSGPVTVTNGMTVTAAQIPSLTYTPALNANGSARSTFDYTVNDAGTGTVAAAMSLNVTAVNDVPVAQASSVTTNEDTAKTFAVPDFLFNDVEGDSLVSITISGLSLTGADTLTVDLGFNPGPVANGMTITAAQIATLVYSPALDANGVARSSFDYTVNDAENGTVPATMSIDVTAVNDAPVAQASSVTTVEDTAKTFATSDFLFNDVESNSLVSLTVSNLTLVGGDTLTVDQGSGPVTVANGMTITATEIATLIYTPALNATGTARSTFDFQVNDADLGTAAATMSIDVTLDNDVPVAQASSVTTNEDTAKTFATSDFQFTDTEADSLVSITVSNLTLASGDTLTVDQGSGPVAVTDSMTITAAQIATLIYTPDLNANGSARTTFDFKVNDTQSGTVVATMSVNVTAVNDAPVLATIETLPLPYAPSAAPTVITSALTLADVDNTNFTGATVQITGGYLSGDLLSFTNTASITGVWNEAGTLTLSGNDTLANYEAALRSVTYSSITKSPAARIVSFRLNDGQAANNLSNLAPRTVGGYAQLVGTTLNVYGTPLADTITVTETATLTIVVNGTSTVFTPAAVTEINIYGFAGTDGITVNSLLVGTALQAEGGDNNDTLTVNSGVTQGVTLVGGGGNDILTGGAGGDTYVFDADFDLGIDTINETGAGVDTLDFSSTTTRGIAINLATATSQVVNAALSLILSSATTIENVLGGTLNDTFTGNSLANVLTGGAGNDLYLFDTDLALGSDTINESGVGTDTVDFSGTTTRNVTIDLSSVSPQVVNAGQTLTLTSATTIENVIGGALHDTFTGNSLNNIVTGGAGNDTYNFNTDLALGSDTINEAGGGTDKLDFSGTTTRNLTISLATATSQVVNAGLTLTLSADNTMENVIGGALHDTITGNSLNNVLTGGAGDDTYRFNTDLALGSDTLNEAGGGTDTLDFGVTATRSVVIDLSKTTLQVVNAGLSLTLSSGAVIENVIAGALNDTLTGNSLNNSLVGGAGNDTYFFDTDLTLGTDSINEAGGGTDTLNFSATTTKALTIDLSNAAAQVVNTGLTLTLSSDTTIENVVGGALNDTITGNSRPNAFTGGAGNDTYLFNTDLALGSDTVDEAGGGTDTLDFGVTTTRNIVLDLSKTTLQVVNAGLMLTLTSGTTFENVIGGVMNDTFTGNSLANVLTGGAGNDTYLFTTDLALGSDTINEAGGGTDTLDFSGTAGRNVVIDLSRATSQVVNAGLTLTLSSGATIENVVGGTLNDTFTGNSLNNVLTGRSGNDLYLFDTDLTLGSDTVNEAGGGTDSLDFSGTTTLGVTIDLSNAASQVVNAGLTLTLSAGNTVENVLGGALNDTFTGNSLNNVLTGGAGNDTYAFDGDLALGSDTINEAGGGTDTLDLAGTTTRSVVIDLSKAALQIVNAGLSLTLSSGATIENVIAGAFNDTLTGNSLNNLLTGGAGNDTYFFDTDSALGSDTIDEAGGGTDTVNFSATTTQSLTLDLSNATAQVVSTGLTLTLSADTAIENVVGGTLHDTFTGNSRPNVFTGGAGNDTYFFNTDLALGSDTIDEAGGGTDTLNLGATTTRNIAINLSTATSQVVNAGLTLTLTSGTTIENVISGALNDTLTGNSLANVMTGGAGNDTYLFASDLALGSDTINEAGGGTDTLDFTATAGRNVVIDLSRATSQVVNAGLTLTLSSGTTIENVIGGALNDTFTGNSLDNVLTGRAGNDTYLFDTDLALGIDTVNEAGGGTDVLNFSGTTTLDVTIDLSNAAAQVVNTGLTLTLSAGNTLENVIGGTLHDTITGNSLTNILTGGAGNDTYVFDTDLALGNDTINEAGGGVDTLDLGGTTTRNIVMDLSKATSQVVNLGLTLTLSAGNTLENVIGGTLNDSFTGNSLANTFTGGAGNDIYLFDVDLAHGSDTLVEAGGGTDTLDFGLTTTQSLTVDLSNAAAQVVHTGLTLTLSAGNTLENVIGGALHDTLTGNSLANVLTGGAGNDTYVFDTDLTLGSDTINEAGGGIDSLNFSATTTSVVAVDLSSATAQVVNSGLTLTLSSAATLENVIGGALGDTLIGNALANVLTGGAGNDTLVGGAGKNILIGGTGTDSLTGGTTEDLLLGAQYSNEANSAALISLLNEWTSASSYATRQAHLLGTLTGGLNGTLVLSSTTVTEDDEKDTLTGGSGKDWYLRNSLGATLANRDTITDTDIDSVFTEIDTWL